MKSVRVNLGKRSYDVVVGDNCLSSLGKLLKRLDIGKDAVVITNSVIFSLYGRKLKRSLERAGLSVRFEKVPDTEKAKSHRQFIHLIGRIASFDKKRQIFIVAFGGGVVGDLAGFIAAVYKRGIPYVQVPTTLLAQVDSAIGGKVAIDLELGKNLVGAFYQPRLVFSDLALLNSLSLRQIRSGLAEIIKYGVIKDAGLFCYLEDSYRRLLKRDKSSLADVILRSAKIKAKIAGEDERDTKDKRIVLNFGHTIGHAIEAAAGYSKAVSHGEAVAVGMILASNIAWELKMLASDSLHRIEALIERIGLPAEITGIDLAKIMPAFYRDKKIIRGKNRFVLPVRIGQVRVVEDVSHNLIVKALAKRTRVTL